MQQLRAEESASSMPTLGDQPTSVSRADLRAKETLSTPLHLSFPLDPAAERAPYIDHWVVQLYGVSVRAMDSRKVLLDALRRVVQVLGLRRVSEHAHYFGPGLSAVIILAESHLAAHTWPERGYAHLDIVTCEPVLNAAALESILREEFQPQGIQVARIHYSQSSTESNNT